MAEDTLKGLNVAILVTDGFEEVELTGPRKALDEAGATTKIVSPKHPLVRAWNFTDWSIALSVDVELDEARPEDFDALLLPGGVINPDSLRIEPKAVALPTVPSSCPTILPVPSTGSPINRQRHSRRRPCTAH